MNKGEQLETCATEELPRDYLSKIKIRYRFWKSKHVPAPLCSHYVLLQERMIPVDSSALEAQEG